MAILLEVCFVGDAWGTPVFPVEALLYYRATFRLKAARPGYFWVNFNDAQGRQLDVDHVTSFDAADGWVDQTYCFRPPVDAATASIRIVPPTGEAADVEAMWVGRCSLQDVNAWQDRIQAELQDVAPVPVASRSQAIPRTAAALRTGAPLRMVMLGDSIINDTCNSLFDARIAERHGHSALKVIASIRSGTGCWHYCQDSRVQSYVLRHSPDVLAIGGISQKDDVDAIASIINQVRNRIDPEIILMTGPVGDNGDARMDGWAERTALVGDSYAARLKALADERGCAFVDMARVWGETVAASGMPYGHFLRDAVHANLRGQMILARILDNWFDLTTVSLE